MRLFGKKDPPAPAVPPRRPRTAESASQAAAPAGRGAEQAADRWATDQAPPAPPPAAGGSGVHLKAPSADKGSSPAPPLQVPPTLQRLSQSYGLKPGISLSRELQSPDPKVRLHGLTQLEKAAGNWDPYIEMVRHDPDPKMQRELLRVLLKHESQLSPALIEGILSDHLSPSTPEVLRFLTLGELSFLKTINLGPFLRAYAEDPDEKFRRSVVQTAVHRADDLSPEDVRLVLSVQLSSPKVDHRLVTMDFLAKKRTIPLSPYMGMCAGENEPKVRQAMYRVLADAERFLALPKAEAEAVFRAELTASDPQRRLTAIAFMKTCPDFGKRALLTDCLADPTSGEKVQSAARKALQSLI